MSTLIMMFLWLCSLRNLAGLDNHQHYYRRLRRQPAGEADAVISPY